MVEVSTGADWWVTIDLPSTNLAGLLSLSSMRLK